VGLKDWFSKDAKNSRAVGRWSKKLMNKYHQTAERKRAIEALAEIGSQEAVVALLQRFQYRTEQTIVDEDEKDQVFRTVVQLGEGAVPALVEYISTQTGVYWPTKALRSIVGEEEAARHVLNALDGIPDSFGENRGRREELVDNLRNFAQYEDVYNRLRELLSDDDEEVVIRAIDGMSARVGDPAVAEAVIPKLLQEDTSIRVRTLAIELIIEQEWSIPKEHKKAFRDIIPEAYFVDDTGVVRRK
jgi:hypothetical protein